MNHHFQYAHHRRIIVHNTNVPTASPISQLLYFFSDYCEKYCKEPPPQPERFEPCDSKNHRIVGVALRQHFSPANILRQRTRNSTEIYSARIGGIDFHRAPLRSMVNTSQSVAAERVSVCGYCAIGAPDTAKQLSFNPHASYYL
jgi:hypothetical protein